VKPLTEPTSKKSTKKPFSAKFCPKCGSTDIFWAMGLPQLWSMWDCKNCGYHGPLILEHGNLAEKLQQEWEKKKQV
jgi:transcription factor S